MLRALPRLLVYLGCAGSVVGLSLIHAARNGYDYTDSYRFAWSIAYISILLVVTYGAGFPDIAGRGIRAAWQAVVTLAVAALAMSAVQLFVGDALLPRFVVFGAAVVLVPWLALCATFASGGRARAEDRARVLFVGGADEAEALRRELGGGSAERPAQVVAAVETDKARSERTDEQPLVDLAVQTRAGVVVLARSAQDDATIIHQAASLHERGIRVRTLSLFYEQWLGKLPLSELERVSLMFDISEVHRALYSRVTRAVDVLLSLVGMVVLVPITLVVIVGNLLGNRGPLFYTQPRVGKNGRVFEIVKFRTMRPATTGLVNEWTTEDDPRITPFGALLRRAHIDESPQMLNIFKGDLSLVGPRPEQPHYVEELVSKLPFYDLRHLVRPGLTGWAQVKYGYAGSESDALEKLQYEFYYLRHQSLSLDALVLIRTLRSVIGRRGR
ncbi:MAG TPA: sugar transferase [Acidimicrobiales bacterium]